MLQSSTLALRRALAHARRPAPASIVATAAAPSLQQLLLLTAPHRRRCLSSAPPKQEGPPAVAPEGGDRKPKEEVSEKEAARLKKIAKIKEEIRRGYFYELGEMNRTKGKVRTCTGIDMCKVDRIGSGC